MKLIRTYLKKTALLIITSSLSVVILVSIAEPGLTHALPSGPGALDPWQTSSNSLPNGYAYTSSAVNNNYVYILGGQNGPYYNSTKESAVYYAQLNSDGSVGTWQTASNSLPVPLSYATSVVSNGYLYEFGGQSTSNSPVSTVYYAQLNSDGSVGTWQTASNALPSVVDGATSVMNNGYVYVMGGGDDSGNDLSTVYYALLNPNGSVGTWQTASNALPAALGLAGSSVYNGYVYFLGGDYGFGPTEVSTVYYALLNPNGSVGTWQTSTSILPYNLAAINTVVNNGYLYEVGGYTNVGFSGAVYDAQLNSDGSVGSWTYTNSPPNGLVAGATLFNDGHLYSIGGLEVSSNNLGVVTSPAVSYTNLATAPVTSQTVSSASTSSPIVVTTPSGTNITCTNSVTQASQTKHDSGYSYPLGLVNLCFTTNTINNQVTLTFVTNLTPSEVVARDYNINTGTYSTIPGAVITETTYNSQPALQLTYNIADNGPLDVNGAYGAVTDPVGLAVASDSITSSKAPDTGFGVNESSETGTIVLYSLMSVGLVVIGLGLRKANR
jgi:N-acetylneuraminic acid mutarotase